jgi:hypothetical protein
MRTLWPSIFPFWMSLGLDDVPLNLEIRERSRRPAGLRQATRGKEPPLSASASSPSATTLGHLPSNPVRGGSAGIQRELGNGGSNREDRANQYCEPWRLPHIDPPKDAVDVVDGRLSSHRLGTDDCRFHSPRLTLRIRRSSLGDAWAFSV